MQASLFFRCAASGNRFADLTVFRDGKSLYGQREEKLTEMFACRAWLWLLPSLQFAKENRFDCAAKAKKILKDIHHLRATVSKQFKSNAGRPVSPAGRIGEDDPRRLMISVNICSPTMDFAAPWDDLVRRASSNVFMNPVALTAANESGFASIHVLLACDDSTGLKRLSAYGPFKFAEFRGCGPRCLKRCPTIRFSSSPIVDPAFVRDVIPSAIRDSRSLPKVISLKSFDAEARSFETLVDAPTEQGCAYLRLSENARPFANPDIGVKRSGSTRKKLRQDWNRLSAVGSVDIVNLRAPDTTEAFETFLKLEAASWKGARGTALLCKSADAAFARQMIAALAERGDASVALLRVDRQAIAAQVLMYCGATAYTWKTAFSHDYAKYSPGVLLIDRITDDLF